MFLKHGANDFINKPFSKEEFSCRLCNAIEALENIDALTNYSHRDFVTGLYNRRHFLSMMNDYFNEALSRDEEFITAMVSIDNFKAIHDSYGSEIADNAMIHVSEIVHSSIEYHDLLARFEGEEFCLILKNIGRDEGIDILDRIRQKIERTPLVTAEAQEIFLNVSIGAIIEHEDSLSQTMNEADVQLHHAKSSGKNKLCAV
jgi:diguanylate cyclase (GGDEF)-like protein